MTETIIGGNKRRPRRVERIQVTSREQWLALRKRDVTASVVGALFGAHPYETPLGLYTIKSGVVEIPDEDNKVLRRGRLLESAVAAAYAEEHPAWKIVKAHVYLRDRKVRIGATPDFFCTDPEGRRVVLQAKTVSPGEFRKHWTEETPPFWISLQTLTEAMLDNAHRGIIAALVVDGWHFDLHHYEVPRHREAEGRIMDAVTNFWSDVEAGRMPKVDYERDGALLAVMYPRHVPGKILDLRMDNRMPELLIQRDGVQQVMKKGKQTLETIETEIKAKLTDAQGAMCNGWNVSFKEQGRSGYTVEPTSFRVLRATQIKPKEETT